MTIHESAEDYLEKILMLQERNGTVRSIDIVNELGYSKPSVSIAMKKLFENGYISIDENKYLTLQKAGLVIAKKMYDRHVTLTKLLVKIGVSEKTALKDACRIEHVLSDETYKCLKKVL